MDPHTRKKCKKGVHIIFTCSTEEKLPKLELLFIHSQREKTGDKGGMRIGNQDFPESHRQDAYMKRKHAEDQGIYTAKKTAAEYKKLLEEVPSRIEEGPEDVYVESELNTGKDLPIKKRNTLDITGLASTALRFEVSNREAAACATAFLGDLIKGGHLSPEAAYLAVDPAKVQRARDALIVKATSSGLEDLEEDKPHCLLFDARIDSTKVLHYDEETEKFYPRVEKEDHYTITDGDGVYLTHITKPGKREEIEEEEDHKDDDTSDVGKKPGEVVARLIMKWIKEHGVENTLKLLGGDSTASNIGWRGGTIAWIEKLLGRKVHWLICMIHTNELGLRHLIELTDGKTDSKEGYSGPLGKLLKICP